MRESGLARIECPISANRPPYRGPASGTNINLVAALHAITQKRKTSLSPPLSLFERPISRRTLVTLSLSLLYLMRFFWRRRRNILEKRGEEYLYLFFGEKVRKERKDAIGKISKGIVSSSSSSEKVYNTDSTINVIDFLLSAR